MLLYFYSFFQIGFIYKTLISLSLNTSLVFDFNVILVSFYLDEIITVNLYLCLLFL